MGAFCGIGELLGNIFLYGGGFSFQKFQYLLKFDVGICMLRMTARLLAFMNVWCYNKGMEVNIYE